MVCFSLSSVRRSAVGAAALVAVSLLSGCSARRWIASEPVDTAFFECELMERVPKKNDSAMIGELNLNHVTFVQFSLNALQDVRVTLHDEASIRDILSNFSDVTFTRLNDPNPDWDMESELFAKVDPIASSGLVIHYSVDFRQTMGAFYVSPEGQAVWYTGDGQAILLSEPGAVDYQSLVLRFLNYSGDLNLDGLATGQGGNGTHD